MPASSCAARNMRPRRPTPTRPSPSRPSPTGAIRRCRTTRSDSSATWARPTSSSSAAPDFAGRAPAADYPLANQFDEVDALVIFDNVLIPWENVLFYRHTKAATFIRATLHRYSAFAFVQRNLKLADMMIGAALFNARQTGLDKQQAVQEKLAQLAVYREGINAHLTAAIALAEKSPAGLLMPNQSLLYTGRVLACSQLHEMMHIARELVRRADLRDARQGGVRCARDQAVAREVLLGQRKLGRRGSAQAARVRARSAQFGLCRPPPDLPVVRAVAAVRASWPPCTAISIGTGRSISCAKPRISRSGRAGGAGTRVRHERRAGGSGCGTCPGDGGAQAAVPERHEPRRVHGQRGYHRWDRGTAWGDGVGDGLGVRRHAAADPAGLHSSLEPGSRGAARERRLLRQRAARGPDAHFRKFRGPYAPRAAIRSSTAPSGPRKRPERRA